MKGRVNRRGRAALCAALFIALVMIGAHTLMQANDAWQGTGGAIKSVTASDAQRALNLLEPAIAARYAQTTEQSAQGSWIIAAPTTLTVLKFVGRADAIAFFPMCWGVLPDGVGCAIDRASAYALFHATDVSGQSVTLDGKRYPITGVIETDQPLMLVGARMGDALNRVIMADGDLASLCAALEVSVDRWALSDGERIRIAALVCTLPLICLALALIARSPVSLLRRAARAGLALGIVIAALAVVPARFLPGRFSDFEFFTELFADWSRRTLVLPSVRDQMLDRALMGAYLFALCALVILFIGRKGIHETHRKEVYP